MNEKQCNELIKDMQYTLKMNKKVIKDIMLKNRTRSVVISFNINPQEVATMDIFVSKMVISKKDLLNK